MVETEVLIKNFYGIHARPSALIAKEALTFASRLTVYSKNGSAGVDEVLSLMSLGIECGDKVRITAEGSDEQEALNTIAGHFGRNFDFKRQ